MYDLLECFSGLRHELTTILDLRDRVLDQPLDFLRRGCGTACQAANLAGHHRKSASLLAATSRLYRCVQREQVCLESDLINHTDDVGYLPRRLVYLCNG